MRPIGIVLHGTRDIEHHQPWRSARGKGNSRTRPPTREFEVRNDRAYLGWTTGPALGGAERERTL